MLFDDDYFAAIRRVHKEREAEFEKLAADPPMNRAEVGDRVLVAGGPVGRGFAWVRLEALVLEVADTAYRVRFKGRDFCGKPDEDWVHQFCVTDVIGPSKN